MSFYILDLNSIFVVAYFNSNLSFPFSFLFLLNGENNVPSYMSINATPISLEVLLNRCFIRSEIVKIS